MEQDYDFIIIGSGFGGSVSALRLSEKGYKVLVVEKGKWYKSTDFAKTNWNIKKWLWIPLLRCFGIMKLTIFRHINVLSGTGVGGGSLVYANTLPIPKKEFYTTGSWASLANWEQELKPHYQTALKMLGATPNPKLFDGDKELQTLADAMGIPDEFERPNVAIYFGENGKSNPDPYFDGQGPERSGCTFCGGCMTGCRYNAKNTLDKNYLYLAQKYGAEILAENEVVDVQQNGEHNGYRVYLKSSTRVFGKKRSIASKGVIFSGGVLGTIKLLLKLKMKSLPKLSDHLGNDIRTNNETLISVSTTDKAKDVSRGIAIGSLLHTDKNSHLEIVRYSKGSDFWKLSHLPYATGKNILVRLVKMLGAFVSSPWSYLKIYLGQAWAKHTVVLLFMQTLDSTLKFRRGIFGGLKSTVGKGKKPTINLPESIALTEAYSKIINGKPTSFAMETLAGMPSTAHILGGAVMAKDESEGVIDENNRVFNYPNMYVIDGSMISANPGVNPSLSITAIAERAMSLIPIKGAS